MIEIDRRFDGNWKFDQQNSELSFPAPLRWMVRIRVTGDEMDVQEEITRTTGISTVTVLARGNGERFPVTGSWAVDEIAYVPSGPGTLAGKGWKGGALALDETLEVTEDGNRMIQTLELIADGRVAAKGRLVFERVRADQAPN